MLHPKLIMLLAAAINFCYEKDIHCRITSMVRTHTDGFSASKTHQEGRALDISTKEWDHQTAIDFTNFINDEFEHLGAISANDGKARAAIYHDVGLGKHIHLQVRN